MVMALSKAGKTVFRVFIFSALPSAVTMTLGNGVLCRVQHSAKWPKTTIFIFLHSIMTNKFIQTYISSITCISHPSYIYLIHPHIHPPISHPSQYIIISAQVHPNKSTSPSKSTSASQVYHKSITKWTTNVKNTTCAHLGHCDCGEGPDASFVGAWGGLFEPPLDGDCTKEKRLHVGQDYFDS